ncbi:MAG TPA: SDR family NAD(P)-dependent oxidoreductase [Candidatus Binatia bacterium]|nr:SDR family NAD(P)-dependent oxidoreductase [Candidatus Binatia bacterium]
MAFAWRRALVVGASSGIGAAVARELGAAGVAVALVARRAAELDGVARAIADAGGSARVWVHDVTHGEEVAALFATIVREMGGLDLVVYAAGVMPRTPPDTYDLARDRETVLVNFLGAVAWLNEAAARFGRAGAGTIVGIGSVAGDRGRRGQPVYGATKAALATYLDALRHRLARRGVAVVTVKPGPVDTAMTRGLDRVPFRVSAEAAAKALLAAAAARARTAYVPRRWRPIMFVVRRIPAPVFERLDL